MNERTKNMVRYFDNSLKHSVRLLNGSNFDRSTYLLFSCIKDELTRILKCQGFELTRKADVIGVSFVEYNPRLDSNYITGIRLVNLVFLFLSQKYRGLCSNV